MPENGNSVIELISLYYIYVFFKKIFILLRKCLILENIYCVQKLFSKIVQLGNIYDTLCMQLAK